MVVETFPVREDTSEDFSGFPFDLLLLSSDVRNDVVEDVEGRDSGVSSS